MSNVSPARDIDEDTTEKLPQRSAGSGWGRRLTPSFSLRTMLWLVLLSAIACVWWRDRQRLETRITQLEQRLGVSPGISQFATSAWNASQATGKPNSLGTGDQQTAWAPGSMDGGKEWLELKYASRIKPQSIMIHEVCSGGCVTQVTAFDFWGNEIALWRGVDPSAKGIGSGISTIKPSTPVTTNRIRVYIDTKLATGWNEIDAVGIQDANGKTHWASEAKASSNFGQGVTYYPNKSWTGFILDLF